MTYNKIYAVIGEERHITLDPINYQYDVKQILVITGETVPDYYEADVCNVGDTATLTMVGTAADGVEIPDKFLLDGRNVLVYVVIPGSGGDVQTRYDITIPVDERAEREDIDPSEAEQQQIDSLINALNSGVGRAEAAAADAEESSGDAADYAADAEAWAVGQRDGVDVDTLDPTYHNNSKYYAGIAEAAAEEAGQHEASWESWVRRAESAADDAEGSARAAAGSKADAETAAQAAAQKATAAASSATAAAGSASEARQTVDGGVGAINTARDGALTAIGQAGTTQVNAVNQAGAAQVTAVNQAGTTQVQAVEDKGNEVLNSIPQDYSDLVDDVDDLSRHLDDMVAINTVVAKQKPNNYIKRTALIFGEYIDASGDAVTGSGWYRTDYVDISGNKYLTYSGLVGNTAFYDENKTYISTVSGGNKIVSIPSEAVFIRASVNEANLATAMINAGEIVLPYDDGSLYIEIIAQNNLAIAEHKNLFNKVIVKGNSYINYTNGAIGVASGFNASDYIPVIPNRPYTISNLVNGSIGSLAFYSSDKTYISGLANSGINSKLTVTIPNNVYFMRITISSAALGNTQVELGAEQTAFAEYDVKELDGFYYPNRTGYNIVYTDTDPNNLLVKSELIPGCYVNASGAVAYASGWYVTPFIDIGEYTVLTLSGQPGSFCFYNANKEFISQSSANKTNFAIPENAQYLRVSVSEANKNSVNVNASSYALPYDDGHIVINTNDIHKTIIVDKNGTGDYTSLTEAMYKNYNSGCVFVVRPGVYDLYEEFRAYFGSTVFDNESFGNAGLPINNCDVIMDAGVIVTFEYNGSTQAVMNIFSPFKFEGVGGVLKGGQIRSANCRYAIHDDVYYTSEHSKSVIDGVKIYHRSVNNAAIGGGLGQSSDILVQNCYIDTGTTDIGYGIFYHNTPNGQGQSYIKIVNNYCTSRIMIEPYGESTKESVAIVANNKCYSVFKQMGGDNDNITMVAYNNDTTV